MGKVKTTSLANIAYEKIKSNIITNKLKPGELLRSTQIAEELNMSRTPIREAISTLEKEGLVEIKNGVGVLVTEISESTLVELFEIRSVLELLALKMLMRKTFDQSIFLNLKKKWLDLKVRFDEGDMNIFDEINELDRRTHQEIRNHSGSVLLKTLIEDNIELRMNRIQCLSVYALNDAENTIQQHVDLLRLILENDYLKASSVLEKHISDAIHYILDAQRKISVT